jgi:hypothetical protein
MLPMEWNKIFIAKKSWLHNLFSVLKWHQNEVPKIPEMVFSFIV